MIAGLAVALTVVACCAQQILRRDGDPELFVNASRLLLKGQDIYAIPSPHGNYYLYPPLFAFLTIPLTILPVYVLIVVWALASVCLLGWSMAGFYSGIAGQPFMSIPARARWLVGFLSILFTSRFIMSELRFGQTNVFVMALVVLGLTWVTEMRPARGGIAIGFSTVIKVLSLPFAFWFLARRSGRVLWGIILGGILGLALPALIVGVRQDIRYHRDWAERIVVANAPGSGNWTNNQNLSLRALADRLLLKGSAFQSENVSYDVTVVDLPVRVVSVLGYLLMAGVALLIVAYAVRFRNSPALVSTWGGYAFVFSLIPNFSTVTEIPHLVLLLPAYLYVAHVWYVQRLRDPAFRLLVVLSFVFSTLTTKTFCGPFLGRFLALVGIINVGMLLLSAAIFRAGILLGNAAGGRETKVAV